MKIQWVSQKPPRNLQTPGNPVGLNAAMYMELARLEDVKKSQTFTADMCLDSQEFNSQTHATTYAL